MRAVAYRVRCVLRGRLAATVGVTMIVAVVSGVVIAFAAGAQRTSTAPDRYTTAFGETSEGVIVQDDRGKPVDREVAALPGVQAVSSMSFVFGGLTDSEGRDVDFTLVFAGSYRGSGVRLIAGRAADPANEHEFVATSNFIAKNHGKIGDTWTLVTLTSEQSRQGGFDISDPQGPKVSMVLVGIVNGASQLDDGTPVAYVSSALLDSDIGLATSLISVDLRPGVDLAELRSEMDADPAVAPFSLEPAVLISEPVRNAVQAQARSLWALAAVAVIAAIAVLGQVIARQVRPTSDERRRLSAIGFTQSQVLAEAVAHAVIPITVGSLLGAALAVTPSGRFPFGFVRVLEPKPGVRVDWPVLAGGAALFIIALTLWTVAALTLSSRATRSVRPSPLVEVVATHTSSVTAGVGIRFAFGGRARDRSSVRGSVAGLLLSVAGVVAAVTFGSSLDRLVTQSFRYGANYDGLVGDDGAEVLPDGIVDRLNANDDVESLVLYSTSQARVADKSVPILGIQALRGHGQPPVLEGRLPSSDDEIAFGRLSAGDIGAHVGDDIELAGPTGSQRFHVTGLAVVPGVGGNDGLGSGAIVTPGGLEHLDADVLPVSVAFKVHGSVEAFAQTVPELADLRSTNVPQPPVIRNVARVRAIPYALAAVLAALALLTVAHVMLTSLRGRRPELAIVRALGADPGWIRRAVHWQATVLTALPVVLAIPLGIVIGRLIFTAFADSMGAVDDAAVPLPTFALGAVGVVIVANGVAAIAFKRVRRRDPAGLLQGE